MGVGWVKLSVRTTPGNGLRALSLTAVIVIVGRVVVPSEVVRVDVEVVEVVAAVVISIIDVPAMTDDVDVGQSDVFRSVTVVVARSRPRLARPCASLSRAFRSAIL